MAKYFEIFRRTLSRQEELLVTLSPSVWLPVEAIAEEMGTQTNNVYVYARKINAKAGHPAVVIDNGRMRLARSVYVSLVDTHLHGGG